MAEMIRWIGELRDYEGISLGKLVDVNLLYVLVFIWSSLCLNDIHKKRLSFLNFELKLFCFLTFLILNKCSSLLNF